MYENLEKDFVENPLGSEFEMVVLNTTASWTLLAELLANFWKLVKEATMRKQWNPELK